jgi:hypothetical protein
VADKVTISENRPKKIRRPLMMSIMGSPSARPATDDEPDNEPARGAPQSTDANTVSPSARPPNLNSNGCQNKYPSGSSDARACQFKAVTETKKTGSSDARACQKELLDTQTENSCAEAAKRAAKSLCPEGPLPEHETFYQFGCSYTKPVTGEEAAQANSVLERDRDNGDNLNNIDSTDIEEVSNDPSSPHFQATTQCVKDSSNSSNKKSRPGECLVAKIPGGNSQDKCSWKDDDYVYFTGQPQCSCNGFKLEHINKHKPGMYCDLGDVAKALKEKEVRRRKLRVENRSY